MDYIPINNNPNYTPNIIDRYNTPFDHLDRILLQNFNEVLGTDGEDNYFKKLFTFKFHDEADKLQGVVDIEMRDQYGVDYGPVNDVFHNKSTGRAGEFFVDSFTYTPFIDYSQAGEGGDSKIGVYSDKFLNDYNSGKYEKGYKWVEGKQEQVDENRRPLTSNLYKLRNLEKDLYDAKVKFREAILDTDEKAFIYVFCEHLATLFAKLSNIRMSHEFYGFKIPHHEWEGMLALDIWYQMLYKEIDAQYAFDDNYLNMNPMAKKVVMDDGDGQGQYVEFEGLGKVYKNNMPDHLEWISLYDEEDTDGLDVVSNARPIRDLIVSDGSDNADDVPAGTISLTNDDFLTWPMVSGDGKYDVVRAINDENTETEYALIWNAGLAATYKGNSRKITNQRRGCVSPREVLNKIWELLNSRIPVDSITETEDDGDFPWFKQTGKVYTEDKATFTKYVNLHLGRAYEVMSSADYNELFKNDVVDGQFVKPDFTGGRAKFKTMLERGCTALEDAFTAIDNWHLFNIFNQETKQVEQFEPENRKNYSQAQCAIVIERIFSGLYKYLSFKSTTGESIQRHVNIDSGYKYLESESIIGSDNPNSHVYYNEDDEVPYLRYLTKLKTYLRKNQTFLTPNQYDVLEEFIEVLSKKDEDWLRTQWDLCPVCKELRREAKLKSRWVEVIPNEPEEVEEDNPDGTSTVVEDEEPPPEEFHVRRINLYFNLEPYMEFGTLNMDAGEGNVNLDGKGRPWRVKKVWEVQDSNISVDLSTEFAFNERPSYSEDGHVVEYSLVGFATERNSFTMRYAPDAVITKDDFDLDNPRIPLNLYAVWNVNHVIVKFSSGEVVSDRRMSPILLENDTIHTLPACGFVSSSRVPTCIYHESPTGRWTNDIARLNEITEYNSKPMFKFKNWEYGSGANIVKVQDGGKIQVKSSMGRKPVVELVAKWEVAYDVLPFYVDDERFCDVLVDRESPHVRYPSENPFMTLADGLDFLSWDKPSGQWLVGMEYNGHDKIVGGDDDGQVVCDNYVVCGEEDGPRIEGYEDGHIFCDIPTVSVPTKVGVYSPIHAEMVGDEFVSFNVTFKYLDEDGHVESAHMRVEENMMLPVFHLHRTIETDERKFLFRYWRLESGTLTSSRTVMSDCVLVAVYDEVQAPGVGKSEPVPQDKVSYIDMSTQTEGLEFSACPFCSQGPNREGKTYCMFVGQNPLGEKESEVNVSDAIVWGDPEDVLEHLVRGPDDEPILCRRDTFLRDTVYDVPFLRCPYLNLLFRAKRVDDDFKWMTHIEIQDVVDLLHALFKINIDIAHKEYFLKLEQPEKTDWWYGYKDGKKWVSFEPSIEFKFSNFHAANQLVNGRLVCTVSGKNASETPKNMWVKPVNNELLDDAKEGGIHYSDLNYFYDYRKTLAGMWGVESGAVDSLEKRTLDNLNDQQRYYTIQPLHLYENTDVQSPVDVNDFIKHRYSENNPIRRSATQVRTFTSIVKKYRPIIMPDVRDIFNDCIGALTKYEADRDNDYGVFGWCSIPSKTMVNMEYNEESIVVPSSYDHHNRIGGSNFLQMDSDLENIYKRWCGTKENGWLEDNVRNSWYYLYNQRDWTYFLLPFFNIKQNSDLYSYMLDTYNEVERPKNSNHINGVIFESSNVDRSQDESFGDIVHACEFLAKFHHNEKNLRLLVEDSSLGLSYAKIKELTAGEDGQFNSIYGSECYDYKENTRIPYQDFVDDYNKTGAYVGLSVDTYNISIHENTQPVYKYNLGQAHAIDDFDEDSVWFYITMVEPLEDMNQVIELEDIMPFVFWWENRGKENNGPTVDCYGRESSSKLNYDEGGYCYSNAYETQGEEVEVDELGQETRTAIMTDEHRWHAVQRTIGTDFSKKDYGGTILTMDNSGNVYKGAFDPNCSGTDEKWKIHDIANSFGADQHEDPKEDKYYHGEETHGEAEFAGKAVPDEMNEEILDSIQNRPMTWNLWNVVRHYAYFKYFKNKHRSLGKQMSAWRDLENYTKKIVKGIYRTFQQNKWKNGLDRATFNDIDGSPTNYGGMCQVGWTNSFVEIHTILERNAREHQASFVIFTGDVRPPQDDDIPQIVQDWKDGFRKYEDA